MRREHRRRLYSVPNDEPGVQLTGTIAKTDDEQQIVFGWFYVSKDAAGVVQRDHSGEWAPIEEIEKAVYPYVLEVGEHGNRHVIKGTGRLVESVVFTPEKLEKMGIPPGAVPQGWWGGFKITDPDAWREIKRGNLPMFSIAGSGTRKAVVT